MRNHLITWPRDRTDLSAAHLQLKSRETCRFANSVHNVESDRGQSFNPALLVAFHMKTKALVDCLICSLTGSICLRMIRCQEFQLDTGQFVESPPKFRREKFVTI